MVFEVIDQWTDHSQNGVWSQRAPILKGGELATEDQLMLMKTRDKTVNFQILGSQVGLDAGIVDRLGEDGCDNLEAYISNSADSTLVSFRYDAVRWLAWAETNDVDPLAPKARDVRDYAKDVENGLSPSSVKRMVSNVGVLTGKIAGNANQTSSILVAAEMKRQRRKKGAGHKQALAIRQRGDVMNIDESPEPFSIERMLQAIATDESLWAARAKLLLSLGGDRRPCRYPHRAARYSAIIKDDLWYVFFRRAHPGNRVRGERRME
jgi:predicted RNA-binding protein